MAKRTPDRYDAAVAYLTANPDQIQDAWNRPHTHTAGCLFLFATPTGAVDNRPDGLECGCITQIRSGRKPKPRFDYGAFIRFGNSAWTDSLTSRIRADVRIPTNRKMLRVQHLKLFATWQRRIDKVLKRDPNAGRYTA
jgi:hypothetical protein